MEWFREGMRRNQLFQFIAKLLVLLLVFEPFYFLSRRYDQRCHPEVLETLFNVINRIISPSEAEAARPRVIVPPHNPNDLLVPHETWNGATTILKGVARDLDNNLVGGSYYWDFGDGTQSAPTAITTSTDLENLSATHVYNGLPVGTLILAKLYVTDAAGETSFGEYRLIIRQKTLDIEINKSIDDGLWSLFTSKHGNPVGTITSQYLRTPDNQPGLLGEYFNNQDLAGTPALTRIDPQIRFDWGWGSPGPGLGTSFSVRWTGKVYASKNDLYFFATNSDDGVRLYVNDQLILNNWTGHGPTWDYSKRLYLAQGWHDIRLEYFQGAGTGNIYLEWGGYYWSQWSNGSGYWWNATGSAVQAFEINGHLETGDPDRNPYVTAVKGGLNMLFRWMETRTPASFGKSVWDWKGWGNPDSNGNGIMLDITGDRRIYEIGPVIDAIVATGTPDAISQAGATNVIGRRYQDIVQDLVDMIGFGQTLEGAWRYSWTSDNDNSAAQWPVFGLLAAEKHFGCTVPQWIKDRNLGWLAATQHAAGWFGYTPNYCPHYGCGATTAAGMTQLAFDGVPTTDGRWTRAQAWVETNWNNILNVWDYSPPNSLPFYHYFSIAKAFRVAIPQEITQFSNGLDWYGDPVNGIARKLVNIQNYNRSGWQDGSWPNNNPNWFGPPMTTAWAVITLTRTLFEKPPVAQINATPNPGAVGIPITFDASFSYHLDPAKTIVQYLWDFDASDGVTFTDASGAIVTHAFTPGTIPQEYTVTLRVIDDSTPARFSTATVVVRITDPPHPPVAVIGGPYLAAVGEPVQVDGSGSYDLDEGKTGTGGTEADKITAWDWESDFVAPYGFNEASGKTAALPAFTTSGWKDIALRVTDNTVNAFPSSGQPNLTNVAYGKVYVFRAGIRDLTVRPKEMKNQLKWTHYEGATSYQIMRSEKGPNEGFDIIGSTISTYCVYIDYGVVPKKAYWYRILTEINGEKISSGSSYALGQEQGGVTNRPPVITSKPLIEAQVGNAYSYAVMAYDPEGQPLAYYLDQSPTGMAISTSGLVNWTPTDAQIGPHGITVRVEDPGKASVTQFFTILVKPRPNQKPVAVTGGPYAGQVNTNINFNGTGSYDPDLGDTITTYRWTFGDGAEATGGQVSHKYLNGGTFVVTLYVTDSRGATGYAQTKATINQPPKAHAGGPYQGTVNIPVYFDGSKSSDPDGDVLTYSWSFGDGGTGTGVKPSHTYTVANTYTVTLTVTDGKGGSSTSTVQATILPPNTAPGAYFTVSGRPIAGATLTFDGSGSIDPDGIRSYEWEFGDGTKTTGMIVTHIYRNSGNFTAKLTVTDMLGLPASTTRSLNIVPNQLPQASFSITGQLYAGSTITFDGSASSDMDGSIVSYLWDFGDQTNGIGQVVKHVFAAPGDYTVKLTVTDDLGGKGETTQTITIGRPNLPPIAVTNGPFGGKPNDVITFNGSSSYDQDGDAIVTYQWTFGDGGQATGVQVTHAYTSIGTYNVTLKVTDARGGEGTTTTTAKITETGDFTPPTVAIISPAYGAEITQITDVTGTANDANLRAYYLEISRDGGTIWTTIYTGTTPVVNGKLGTIDPTTLIDDPYLLRLRAEDINGNSSLVQINVNIHSKDLKIGMFNLSFTDLSISLSGIPISIVRSYDSRDKGKHDFGIGWKLALKTTEVKEDENKNVFITLPDGKRTMFTFTPRYRGSWGFTTPIYQPRYTPAPGVHYDLTCPGCGWMQITDFWGTWIDPITWEDYNPKKFILTSKGGKVYTIDKSDGLESVKDPNNNTLTFTANGIIHSSGKAINFSRDSQGRITQIKDFRGNTLKYEYDLNGNLVGFINRKGEKTTLAYDSSHRLVEIKGPSGIIPLRNQYDSAGRLSQQTDALGNVTRYQYDLADRRQTVTDRLGNSTTYSYDERGKITRIVDSLGNVSTGTYDAQGNLLSTTDPLGRTVAMTYDANNNLKTLTDSMGQTYTLNMNSSGQITTVQGTSGISESYGYDSMGNLTSYTDVRGNITRFTFNESGNVVEIAAPMGQKIQMEYNSFGNMTKQTRHTGEVIERAFDGNGNLTVTQRRADGVTYTYERTYDELDRVTSYKNPLGQTTTIEYDENGNTATVTDHFGNRTDYKYDAIGNLTKIQYPDGTEERMEYDAEQRVIGKIDREGRITRFIYDSEGQLIREIFPDGTSISYEYDGAGQIISKTDQRGHVYHYAYNPSGNLIKLTDPLGSIRSYEYNPGTNKLVSSTDPLGRKTRYEYTDNGLAFKTIFPDGSESTSRVDAAGRRISTSDPNGKSMQFTYGSSGRLTKAKDALGQEILYTHNQLGRLTSVSDLMGRKTQFEYDSMGRLLKRTLPLGFSDGRTYNARSQLASVTDYNGNQITFTYDPFNSRVLRKQYPDATGIDYEYSPMGKVLSVRDTRGLTRFSYDLMDRVTKVQYPTGEELAYEYDANGNQTSVTGPHGTISYKYDAANRMIEVRDRDNQVTTFSYDSAGQLVQVLYPNNGTTRYTYDLLGRLTGIENRDPSNSLISSYSYEMDLAGKRIKVVEAPANRIIEYTYDDLSRLIREKTTESGGPTREVSYTYDAMGNRLTKTDSSGTLTYGFDANDRVLTEGPFTFTYDNNGNTLTRTGPGGTEQFEYDYDNRLIRFVSATGATTTYGYDAWGNRVVKQGPSGSVRYLVDMNNMTGLPQVLMESDGAGNPIASYIYAHRLISMARGGAKHYFLNDGRASIREIMNPSGAVTDTFEFDAFGNLTGRTGSTPVPFGFNGEMHDEETGFQYLRARYYMPRAGRFLTADSLMGSPYNLQSYHLYTYTQNNPVNASDPTGHTTLVDLSIANSIRNVLLHVQIDVGFTLYQVYQGTAAGLQMDQIANQWMWGMAFNGLLTFGVPLLLKCRGIIDRINLFKASQWANEKHAYWMQKLGFLDHDKTKGFMFVLGTARKGKDWLTKHFIKNHGILEKTHHGLSKTQEELREKVYDVVFARMEQARAPLMEEARLTVSQMRMKKWEICEQIAKGVDDQFLNQFVSGGGRIGDLFDEALTAADDLIDILSKPNPYTQNIIEPIELTPRQIIYLWLSLRAEQSLDSIKEPLPEE